MIKLKLTQREYGIIGIILIIVGVWQLLRMSKYTIQDYQRHSFSARASEYPAASTSSLLAVEGFENSTLPAIELPSMPVSMPVSKQVSMPVSKNNAHDSTLSKQSPPEQPNNTAAVPFHDIREGLENKTDSPGISNVNFRDAQSKYKLKDYYVKTAYNCFNGEDYKNSNVSYDALRYCLERGVRCLDFEVWSVNNEPVIASSSADSFYYKETYNHLPFSEAIETIGDYAFSNSISPNPLDPLILHIRFRSQNATMYEKMAEIMSKSSMITPRLMGAVYSRENRKNDFGNVALKDLMGKVIIMTDGTNDVFRRTKMHEFINMTSATLFLEKKTFTEVKNIGNPQLFKEHNKKYMCIVLPERGARPENKTAIPAMDSWGCQLVAMCFQASAQDDKLEVYEDKFKSVGYAFVLKPEELRYVPIKIAPPKPVNPAYSYANREFSVPGGGFNI